MAQWFCEISVEGCLQHPADHRSETQSAQVFEFPKAGEYALGFNQIVKLGEVRAPRRHGAHWHFVSVRACVRVWFTACFLCLFRFMGSRVALHSKDAKLNLFRSGLGLFAPEFVLLRAFSNA